MPRYYLTQRPPGPGCQPVGFSGIKAFDERQYCQEIGGFAWGYADYQTDLPKALVEAYELTKALYAEKGNPSV